MFYLTSMKILSSKYKRTFILIILFRKKPKAFYIKMEYLISDFFISIFQFCFYKRFHFSIPITIQSDDAVNVHTQTQGCEVFSGSTTQT